VVTENLRTDDMGDDITQPLYGIPDKVFACLFFLVITWGPRLSGIPSIVKMLRVRNPE
jgi:hypothetical protein